MPGLQGAAGMMLLKADRISVSPGNLPVLNNVSLSIDRGEIVTIIGPNGSGKSTLVRALIGLQPVSSGRVERAPGLRIGYVPQRLKIEAGLPMTVRRFLSLPHRVTDEAAEAALLRTGVPGIGARQLSQLSGGQFQRALLARALLAKPDLLIMDEPTQGLDQPGIAAFYHLIEEFRRETGVAVLMVSHDLHVVMRASDRVVCLNGHVCCEGTPEAVSVAPEYLAMFGTDDGAALALYRHHHDHDHDHDHGPSGHHDHHHDHPEGHGLAPHTQPAGHDGTRGHQHG